MKVTVPNVGISGPGGSEAFSGPCSISLLQVAAAGRGGGQAESHLGVLASSASIRPWGPAEAGWGPCQCSKRGQALRWGHGLCKFNPGVERGHPPSSLYRKHGLRGTRSQRVPEETERGTCPTAESLRSGLTLVASCERPPGQLGTPHSRSVYLLGGTMGEGRAMP